MLIVFNTEAALSALYKKSNKRLPAGEFRRAFDKAADYEEKLALMDSMGLSEFQMRRELDKAVRFIDDGSDLITCLP